MFLVHSGYFFIIKKEPLLLLKNLYSAKLFVKWNTGIMDKLLLDELYKMHKKRRRKGNITWSIDYETFSNIIEYNCGILMQCETMNDNKKWKTTQQLVIFGNRFHCPEIFYALLHFLCYLLQHPNVVLGKIEHIILNPSKSILTIIIWH